MSKPFDNADNPFLQLNMSKVELIEAYSFFNGVDTESQLLIVDALDAKYTLGELFQR
jgi:hypothetical protein|tara:strand:- start:1513 stop:1683 length:171 start_codon:yes stop_codon:yes gene_type:complete